LKTSLTSKASPSWVGAQGSALKVVKQVKSAIQAQPTPVKLTNAARKHFKEVTRANKDSSGTEIDRPLPATDAGLISLVQHYYDDFAETGGKWVFELGHFDTRIISGSIEPTRWTVVGQSTDDGAFLVIHYGPYGGEKGW
jgi:hypothetical protein